MRPDIHLEELRKSSENLSSILAEFKLGTSQIQVSYLQPV